MNALLRGLLACLLVTTLGWAHAASTNAPAGFRLTVELRDGSRLTGTRPEDTDLVFRSAVVGTLKLPLQKIRFVETAAGTNRVKLTTVAGDCLTVAFAEEAIRIATSYGEVSLPVAMIKSIRVSPAGGAVGRPRDGLIGLWSGEGDAVDSVAGNNGTLRNVSFTDGVVGKAFSFVPNNSPYGAYSGVQIPDRPAYALTQSLTVEGWIRPCGDRLVIFFRGDHRPGLDPYCLSVDEHLDLSFGICAEDGTYASVKTPVELGVWTHVAGVLDDSAGTLNLYTNGVLAVQTNTTVRPFGALLADQSPGIGIGNVNDGGNNFPSTGDIDEVGLYNRALSEAEVNALYAEHAADAGGRAAPRPPRNNIPRPMRSWSGGFISD